MALETLHVCGGFVTHLGAGEVRGSLYHRIEASIIGTLGTEEPVAGLILMLLIAMALPIFSITYHRIIGNTPTFGAYLLTVIDVGEYLG